MGKKVLDEVKPIQSTHQPLWVFKAGQQKVSLAIQGMESQINFMIRNMDPLMKTIYLKKQTRTEYHCKFCGKKFFKACALGGHMSKSHSDKKDDGEINEYKNQLQPVKNVDPCSLIGEYLFSATLEDEKAVLNEDFERKM